jgi:hypothetical protein
MDETFLNLALSKGGAFMADFLESKIKPLVQALDTWPGIKTFSSCEGHESPDWRSIPHVTFTCDDDATLREICERLRGTQWRIILEDFSHGPELHYTIRYVSRRLEDKPALQNIQEGIPSIADMLRKDTPFGRQSVENNFPILTCGKCRGSAFGLQANIEFNLSYVDRFYPKLEIGNIDTACITCQHCSEEIMTGSDAITETWRLVDRANKEGPLGAE